MCASGLVRVGFGLKKIAANTFSFEDAHPYLSACSSLDLIKCNHHVHDRAGAWSSNVTRSHVILMNRFLLHHRGTYRFSSCTHKHPRTGGFLSSPSSIVGRSNRPSSCKRFARIEWFMSECARWRTHAARRAFLCIPMYPFSGSSLFLVLLRRIISLESRANAVLQLKSERKRRH